MILSSFAHLIGLSGSLIIFFCKFSENFLLLILRGICYLSGETKVVLAPGLDILKRLGLSLFMFIYFGCSMLILLSDKLAD